MKSQSKTAGCVNKSAGFVTYSFLNKKKNADSEAFQVPVVRDKYMSSV